MSFCETDFRVLDIASSKSWNVTGRSISSRLNILISDGLLPWIRRLIAIIAASRQTFAMSDPEYPFKLSAIAVVSKSLSVETLFRYKFSRAERVSSSKKTVKSLKVH